MAGAGFVREERIMVVKALSLDHLFYGRVYLHTDSGGFVPRDQVQHTEGLLSADAGDADNAGVQRLLRGIHCTMRGC